MPSATRKLQNEVSFSEPAFCISAITVKVSVGVHCLKLTVLSFTDHNVPSQPFDDMLWVSHGSSHVGKASTVSALLFI